MNELSKLVRANNFDFVTIVADPGDKIFVGERSQFRGLILLHGQTKNVVEYPLSGEPVARDLLLAWSRKQVLEIEIPAM